MITTPVTVSIARSQGSDGDRLRIEIKDAASAMRICEVEFSPEQAFYVLTGCSSEGAARIANEHADKWGRKIETKTVIMPMNDRATGGDFAATAERLCVEAERENPGWVASDRTWNGHRRTNAGFAVVLRRWACSGEE